MDNQIYGLTTGQASPTTTKEARTKSTPNGNVELPINPLALALVFLFVRGGSLADITGHGVSDPATSERVDQLLKIVAELEKRLPILENQLMPTGRQRHRHPERRVAVGGSELQDPVRLHTVHQDGEEAPSRPVDDRNPFAEAVLFQFQEQRRRLAVEPREVGQIAHDGRCLPPIASGNLPVACHQGVIPRDGGIMRVVEALTLPD